MKAEASLPPRIPDSFSANGWINAAILIGSGMFVFGLTISAVFAPEWRVLHVFQAPIYIAVVAFTRRKIAAGIRAGLSVSLFWNALSVFATSAARDSIRELAMFVRTGHTQRPDLLLSLFAACGHCLIIIGCIFGFSRIRPSTRQWAQLLIGGTVALGYLIAIVFVLGPPQAVDLMKHVLGI